MLENARIASLLLAVGCAPAISEPSAEQVSFITAASNLPDNGGPRPMVRRTDAAGIARYSDARAVDGSAPVGIFLPDRNLILVRRDEGDDVVVHELTHWLQHAAGQGPGCAAEGEAYRVQALWRERHGLPAASRRDGCDAGAYAALERAVTAEIGRQR